MTDAIARLGKKDIATRNPSTVAAPRRRFATQPAHPLHLLIDRHGRCDADLLDGGVRERDGVVVCATVIGPRDLLLVERVTDFETYREA